MNAEELCAKLGGKRSGRGFQARCPAHDDHDPSLYIFDGHTSLQVRCLTGRCSQQAIIAALKAKGLWGETCERQQSPKHRSLGTPEQNSRLALEIFQAARDPRNTVGDQYLTDRHLRLPTPAKCLQFHEMCPRGYDRYPALVVAMQDLETFKIVAIQRLFLNHRAQKIGAQMLGPAGRAAMMLSDRWHTFWDDLSFCPRLFICEGLESGIGLLNGGYQPVWALGSAGAIARFPVLFGIGEVVIAADHDRAGLDAAIECRARWNASTHQRALIWTPDKEGLDFADPEMLGGFA